MKNIKAQFIIFLAFYSNFVLGQLCAQDQRFTTVAYFSNNQIESIKNKTFSQAIDYLGKSQDLKMDFYFPNNELDALKKRPFILLIHGGGFHGGEKESRAYEAKEFAKRGFVAATMNYRLGYDKNIKDDIQKSVYRAQQDANSALSYAASQAAKLNIDTSWFFIGGSSAGAITSLFTSYASQEEWNQVLPKFESSLGSLESSKNITNKPYTIKGIYNFMGAVQPIVFVSGNMIPIISFHGDEDITVPIGKSKRTGFGSKIIHEMLTEANVCNNLTIVKGGGHGIYRTKEGKEFRINRVSNFFKSILCDNCSSSAFTDEVITNNKDISYNQLRAIKEGNLKELDVLVNNEEIDKCHNIKGGLYNYLAFSIKFKSFESLEYFVNKKADLEGVCTGKTPLMYAAKYGQLAAVKLLLKNGAKVNATNNGKTALDYAVKYNHAEIKKYLVEYKSN